MVLKESVLESTEWLALCASDNFSFHQHVRSLTQRDVSMGSCVSIVFGWFLCSGQTCLNWE